MQRKTAQAFEVIWPFTGHAEFLWMIVTFVFTIIGLLLAPAKAPADRNITASAADSVIVFRVLVIWCSPVWGSCVELESNLGGGSGTPAEWVVHLAFMFPTPGPSPQAGRGKVACVCGIGLLRAAVNS